MPLDSAGHPRTVVITGATRGLGRAMCDRFVELGHTVIGCGRDAGQISSLRERYPAPHDFSVVDVSWDDQVAAWAARVLSDRPGIDLLLNNAALVNRNAPLWEVPAEEFLRLLEVNVLGIANCIRHFAPAMIARRHGVIVNFSSGWGRSTSPDVAPYCATKWAVEGLTKAFSQEIPPEMTTCALNPGIIDTDMLRACFGGDSAQYPSAQQWSLRAVPFLLSLGPQHNGVPVSVP